MKEKPGLSVAQNGFENWVYSNALGVPLILDAAPTTSAGQLAEGNIGIHSTNLYWTINGTTYRIGLTSV